MEMIIPIGFCHKYNSKICTQFEGAVLKEYLNLNDAVDPPNLSNPNYIVYLSDMFLIREWFDKTLVDALHILDL